MELLTTAAEIRAAIATMNPVARMATQSLAAFFLDNPATVRDGDMMNRAMLQHCAMAMDHHGWSLDDKERIRKFFEDHGSAVENVTASIVVFSVRSQQRRQKWGWLGKAAAIGAGVILGSLFG